MKEERYFAGETEMDIGIKLSENLSNSLKDILTNFLSEQHTEKSPAHLILAAAVNSQILCLANTLRLVAEVYSGEEKDRNYEGILQEHLSDAIDALKAYSSDEKCSHPECAAHHKSQIRH